MRWNWYHSTIKWSCRNAMKKKNKEKWKKKKIRTRIRIEYVRSYCSLSDILARVLVIYFITDICMNRSCLYVDFLIHFFPFNKLFFLLFCISCSVLFDHFHSFVEHSPFHVQFRLFFPFQSLCHNFFVLFTISLYFYELCAQSDMHIKAMKSLMWMIQKSSENKCLLNISLSLYTSVALSLAPLDQNE